MLWGSVLVNIISKFPILDHKDLENQGPKKLEMQLLPLHFWHVRNYAFLQNQCLKTQWVCVSPFIPHPDLRQESEQREQCFKAWLHTYSGRYSNLSSCQGSLKKVTSPFPRVALSFLKIRFIYFIFSCAGSLLLCRLSLVTAESWGYPLVEVHRRLIVLASPAAEHAF